MPPRSLPTALPPSATPSSNLTPEQVKRHENLLKRYGESGLREIFFAIDAEQVKAKHKAEEQWPVGNGEGLTPDEISERVGKHNQLEEDYTDAYLKRKHLTRDDMAAIMTIGEEHGWGNMLPPD